MILVELEIEDYKQFAGLHRFTPSPEGIIAIIGHNGAGKTTLFEAIEWCLYQPREIASDEVAPRGKVARPRVKLTLLDPETGIKFVIVRTLSKSRTADAEIYREDSSDTRIVKGSRQSTEHVSRTLIGLSHRAFVSTFFTRQKELTFFGDLKDTDRRREVGRLLGMETIREAQKLIGDERAELQGQAKALELQHRESSEGRDFAQEAESAAINVALKSEIVESNRKVLADAEAEYIAARAAIEQLTALERSDAELRRHLERIDGDIRAAEASLRAATDALARIDADAQERPSHALVAAELELRRLELKRQETLREHHQNRQRIEKELAKVRSTIQETTREMRKQVLSTGSAALPSWQWRSEDDNAPLAAADRLIALASGLDLSTETARIPALELMLRLSTEQTGATKDVTTFRQFLGKLTTELEGLLSAGDPNSSIEKLNRERDAALKFLHESGGRINAIAEEIARLEPVRSRLQAQEIGTICPTCGRPIESDDIAITLGLFNSQISNLESERAQLNRDRPGRQSRLSTIDSDVEAVRKRISEIDALRVRIENGTQRIAEAEEKAETTAATLEEQLRRHNRTTVPTSDEIDRETRRVDALRAISASQALLHRLSIALRNAIGEEIDLTADHAALSGIVYEPASHKLAQEALSESDRATAWIAQIDTLLLQRPIRLAEIAHAQETIGLSRRERVSRETELDALKFDPVILKRSRDQEHAAMLLERSSRERLSTAVAEYQKTVAAQDALLEEHRRIIRLIERSETRAREAGQLDLMYREFNAFEQFVADRLTPQLSDYTSELLQAITDGKYDQVWFNSNYGIEVYDGDDEHFPVEEFSGGERDVIALCARLALSRLIGTQANNPPRFMVLDEVFGSLDRERRAQVLETLGALAGTADAFHQLFIISHVDDVRSSPIFNEVWRVSEGADGVSFLENLNLTGGFDDA